jgi:aldehyde:ferredoxin oxidoreductase
MSWIDMPDNIKRGIFGSPPKLSPLDAPMLTKWFNDLTSVYNSLGLCMFACTTVGELGPTIFADLYSSYSGHATTAYDVMLAGERIFNVIREYNVREGMRREHDNWPQRARRP